MTTLIPLCACRRITRGSLFCAPGCGQAGRPPHPAGIVGQNRCGTLRRRENIPFCGDSHPAASTCFRDRGSGTANSAADDPRSRPGPVKRGEMSRLPVRFARFGAAAPHLTHNPGCRPGPPAPAGRPAQDPPRDSQGGQANPRVKIRGPMSSSGPDIPRQTGHDFGHLLCKVAGKWSSPGQSDAATRARPAGGITKCGYGNGPRRISRPGGPSGPGTCHTGTRCLQ